MQDLAVDADVERPARRDADRAEDAVGVGRGLGGIGEEGVVGLDVLSELGVRLGVVDADGEVGDVERSNGFAALTERLAFDRSATGEGFGEPGDDDRLLALVLGERMGPPIEKLGASSPTFNSTPLCAPPTLAVATPSMTVSPSLNS